MASGNRKRAVDHDNKANTPPAHIPGSVTAGNRNADETKYYLNSPFCDEILTERVNPNFTLPSGLPKYNTVKDPKEHVLMFNHHMLLYNLSDAMRAKVFVTTLEDIAVYWFSRLQPASIQSYSDLCEKFIEHFAGGKRIEMSHRYLETVVQRPNETLRSFINRFNAILLEIENDMRPFCVISHVLAKSVRDREFAMALTVHSPESFQRVMEMAERYMQIEEEQLARIGDNY